MNKREILLCVGILALVVVASLVGYDAAKAVQTINRSPFTKLEHAEIEALNRIARSLDQIANKIDKCSDRR